MESNNQESHLIAQVGPAGPNQQLNGEDPTGVQNVAMQRQMHQQQLHHIMQQQQQQVNKQTPSNCI